MLQILFTASQIYFIDFCYFHCCFSISTKIMLRTIFVRLYRDRYTETVNLIHGNFAVEMGYHEKQISLEPNGMKSTRGVHPLWPNKGVRSV